MEQSLEKKKDPKEDPVKPRPKIDLQPRAEMTSEDDTKVKINGKGKKQLPSKLGAEDVARPSRRSQGSGTDRTATVSTCYG